jgi:cytochrome c5
MSDHSTANAPAQIHLGPVKISKQLLLTVAFSLIIPVFIVIGLVNFVVSGDKPTGSSADPERAVAERIQKVGAVAFREANREPRTGEQVYTAVCSACHQAGMVGSPKFGDSGAWGPRIKTGFDALLNSALKGKNAMPAQGGGDQSDLEVARAVVYMANAGGAKFSEPKAPEAAPAK